ncbi:zinc finger protein 821 isoform X3 [Heterocephalus glaber]|uniref:Zinc finger protein 821 isoform X3 n=1 Tax=Heterocephalus glaber TaxID=10181 RepID=A0AAX6STB6_HETGA|nr:zinc finger protein 821 isoform X3 [Heterocephalus glaber]
MIEDCLKAASFATSCGGLSLPFAVFFFFWLAICKEVVTSWNWERPEVSDQENMSRRKQTNPNKVHWDQVFAGLEEQARQAMMKTDFPGDLGSQRQAIQQLRDQDSSSSDSEGDEEETTQDEVSSHTSEEDGGVVKVEKDLENAEEPVGGNKVVEHEVTENLNSDPLLELCQCPLCQLDCGSREQLIAHVYQGLAV